LRPHVQVRGGGLPIGEWQSRPELIALLLGQDRKCGRVFHLGAQSTPPAKQLRPPASEPISDARGAGRYRSGQTGRTVNPLAYAFAGSNPALPTPHFAYEKRSFEQVSINPDGSRLSAN
jgi:hypothetical protein